MKTSIKNISTLEREMTVQLPSQDIDGHISKRLNKLQKQVQLKGFRRGKVPASVVKAQFGSSVREEVIRDSIGESLKEAFIENELNPVSAPTIESIQSDPGKDVEFKAKFEVFPEIKLTDLAKIEIEKPVAEVVDQDIDQTIERMQKYSTEWLEVDRAAKDQDQVTIDFTGTVDGKGDDRLSAKDHPMVIGSKMMIEGFEAGLVGLSQGEQKTLELQFPADYHSTEFADKKVEFVVNIKKVCEPKLPELNEAFFQKFFPEVKELSEFKQHIRQNLQDQLDKSLKQKLQDNVYQGLLGAHAPDVPNGIIKAETERLIKQIGQQQKSKTPFQPPPEMLTQLQEKAKRNATVSLIVQEIMKANKISVDNQKLTARIDEIAKTFESPEEIKQAIFADEKQLDMISFGVLEEQVLEFILEKALLKEKKYRYDELVK